VQIYLMCLDLFTIFSFMYFHTCYSSRKCRVGSSNPIRWRNNSLWIRAHIYMQRLLFVGRQKSIWKPTGRQPLNVIGLQWNLRPLVEKAFIYHHKKLTEFKRVVGL